MIFLFIYFFYFQTPNSLRVAWNAWLFSALSKKSGKEIQMSPTSQGFFIVFVILIAVYLNFPAPEVSGKVKEWRSSGKYFNYEGLAVFYKGESLKLQWVTC